MKQILIPIDFSEITTAVLNQAKSLAKAFSCKLWILHIAAPDPDFVGFEAGPQVVREQVASKLREEHLSLQKIATNLEQEDIEVEALLIQGPTVETILEKAKELNVDLILLASHGHGALYRALLGSVSEGILRAAPCPVMFIPAAP